MNEYFSFIIIIYMGYSDIYTTVDNHLIELIDIDTKGGLLFQIKLMV